MTQRESEVLVILAQSNGMTGGRLRRTWEDKFKSEMACGELYQILKYAQRRGEVLQVGENYVYQCWESV